MDIDATFTAYVECALWSTLDWGRTDESGNNPPLDENHGIEDIPHETLEAMQTELEEFLSTSAADIALFCERLDFGPEQVGHDFWLTRERHGTGFWDRYSGSDGALQAAIRRLTDSAHAYGNGSDALNEALS